MKELHTEIEIQASPDKVWQVLTNLDQYPDWNPLIPHAIGTTKVGEILVITFRSPSIKMTLHCTIVKLEPNKELRWKFHLFHPALFQGEHSFIIEQVEGNKVRFINKGIFNGLFVPLQAKDIDTNSKKGFEAMNKALKARVE